jgi:phytoene synthase
MYGHDLKSVMRYRIDKRECRSRLRAGSHSFYAASLLLPAIYRQPITALYAFCRVADDEIDAAGARAGALDRLYRRLDRIYAGQPGNSAVERQFADLVLTHRIPYALPAALFEGFEWDLRGREYRSLSDVYAYSARVAGTVGVMMAILMGVRDKEILGRACDLGVAMQLTNIARDVGEDAQAGRVYLPAELLADRGLDVQAWLARPVPGPASAHATRELLRCAARLYRRAEWGIAQLPFACRPAMFAARLIYAEIGAEIERNDYDSVTRRAVVGRRRKLALLAQAAKAATATRRCDRAPILNEARFLIDAVAEA